MPSVISPPRPRRNTELLLLLFALGVVVGADLRGVVGTGGTVDSAAVLPLGAFAAATLGSLTLRLTATLPARATSLPTFTLHLRKRPVRDHQHIRLLGGDDLSSSSHSLAYRARIVHHDADLIADHTMGGGACWRHRLDLAAETAALDAVES